MVVKRVTNLTDKFTLKEARELVIKIKKLDGMADSTILTYHRVFNDLEQYFKSDKIDVKSLTVNDARDYVSYQLHEKTPYKNSSRQDYANTKGISISTTNHYIIMCRAIFNVLEQEEIIENNIFKKVNIIKQDEEEIETLTIDELKRLFKTFDKRNYVDFRNLVACHVMLDAFSRVSETLSIKHSDIDLKKGAITFKRTKGRKIRTVPISRETLRLIKELIRENEVFDTDYVFLTIFGEQLDSDTFRKDLYRAADKADIKKNVYPHLLRHTASKMFMEDGGNIRVLQLILGHASVETTERYAHVLDSTVADIHENYSPISRLKKRSKTRTSRVRR